MCSKIKQYVFFHCWFCLSFWWSASPLFGRSVVLISRASSLHIINTSVHYYTKLLPGKAHPNGFCSWPSQFATLHSRRLVCTIISDLYLLIVPKQLNLNCCSYCICYAYYVYTCINVHGSSLWKLITSTLVVKYVFSILIYYLLSLHMKDSLEQHRKSIL